MIDADPNAGGARSFEQVLRFLGRDAHRLFDEHVDPGLQRFLGQGVMKVRRSQDVDDVDTLLAEHLVDRSVRLCPATGSESLGDFEVGVADGDEFGVAIILDASGMEIGDEARADDRRPDRALLAGRRIERIQEHPR